MVAISRELPASGYALEVDGRLKAEFATRDGAKTGAEELKKRFPMLKIRIYDAQTQTREDVELSCVWRQHAHNVLSASVGPSPFGTGLSAGAETPADRRVFTLRASIPDGRGGEQRYSPTPWTAR